MKPPDAKRLKDLGLKRAPLEEARGEQGARHTHVRSDTAKGDSTTPIRCERAMGGGLRVRRHGSSAARSKLLNVIDEVTKVPSHQGRPAVLD